MVIRASGSELVVRSHLPAVPGEIEGYSMPSKVRDCVRHYLPAFFEEPPDYWLQMIYAASRDTHLRGKVIILRPEGVTTTVNGVTFLDSSTLSNASSWAFLRLNSLMLGLIEAIGRESSASGELTDFGHAIDHMRLRILWDAALDLYMADLLETESRYPTSFDKSRQSNMRAGVLQLRSCILHAVNSLALVRTALIERELAARLQQKQLVPEVREAVEYFACYTQAYLDLTTPPSIETPLSRFKRFWNS